MEFQPNNDQLYKTNHPLYGRRKNFQNWKDLTDYTLRMADQKSKILADKLCDGFHDILSEHLADEMLSTATQVVRKKREL